MTTETGATEFLANIGPGLVLALCAVFTMLRLMLAPNRSTAARSLVELVEALLVAMTLVFLIVRPFLFQAFFIPTSSMEPTLAGHDKGINDSGEYYTDTAHDHLFVNKLVYRLRDPRRGEIVVFRAEKKADLEARYRGLAPQERIFVKRVIGVPGDTIVVRPDRDKIMRVWRDTGDGKGLQPLNEPYVKLANQPVMAMENPQPEGAWDATRQPLRLGPNEYFVMGDNRNHSSDSRFWGTVPRDRFIGTPIITFWPLNRAGVPR